MLLFYFKRYTGQISSQNFPYHTLSIHTNRSHKLDKKLFRDRIHETYNSHNIFNMNACKLTASPLIIPPKVLQIYNIKSRFGDGDFFRAFTISRKWPYICSLVPSHLQRQCWQAYVQSSVTLICHDLLDIWPKNCDDWRLYELFIAEIPNIQLIWPISGNLKQCTTLNLGCLNIPNGWICRH